MIEPKIFPPMSKELHERLINQAKSRSQDGDAAQRTLFVISTRPRTFKLKLFPTAAGNRSEEEFGSN